MFFNLQITQVIDILEDASTTCIIFVDGLQAGMLMLQTIKPAAE